MIKACAFWCGLDLAPAQVAELACYIEMDKMGMPVGKQDQYAAAFGGLNLITFSRDGVDVEPLRMPDGMLEALERNLLLFFTGTSRQSSTILRRQQEASQHGKRETIKRLGALKELGLEIKRVLEEGDLEAFGDLLHQSWMHKRQLTEGITNPLIDQYYETARNRGALGGKVTGAGGGGFLLLCCPEERQEAVTTALEDLGLQRRPFSFDQDGVQVMEAVPWERRHVATRVPLPMKGMQIKPEDVGSSPAGNGA
jgi:D-glycero-alpha-D-manno-heptose-7-phosphate kinase